MPRLSRLGPLTVLTALVFGLVLCDASPAGATSGWSWPLPPPDRVLRGFDPPAQPWLVGHRGVDLAGHAGETVLAAGAGRVAFAGPVAGLPVVSIRHRAGLLTTYEPVVASVAVGDPVRLGEPVGRLVRTGGHCLPDVCLHWGLRRGADYLDPLALLGLGEVRLLPLFRGPDAWPLPGATSTALAASVGPMAAAALVVRRRLSRAGRRACRAAGALPWCASGRCGSR